MLTPLLLLLSARRLGRFSVLSVDERLHRRAGELAPLYGLEHDEVVPDEFIVMFWKSHTHSRHFNTIGRDFSRDEGYTMLDYGYTMNLSDTSLRDAVRRDPEVLLVETNRHVRLVDAVHTEDHDFKYEDYTNGHVKRYTQNTATNVPYGLQMVAAQGKLPTPVENGGTYDYVDRAGQGVNVYVLDSGIRVTHRAFQGRARHFGGLSGSEKSPYCSDTMDDGWGHGTHVAGIIGARTYGVAPNANLINVKITNNNGRGGTTAQLGQAIRDVIKEHNENKEKDPDYRNNPFAFRGSLINLSLGWQGDSGAILQPLIEAEEAGIKVYTAAGNEDIDASNVYPCANVQTACVAAVDSDYEKGWFSNYGSAVDYIGPGDEIISLSHKSDEALVKKWGTSMATAHATGAAAIFTFWQGLVNDQTRGYWGDYVWWNSISELATGFSGTSNLFINTGIHSSEKYSNEPFRWAGDWPVKNHEANADQITATPVLDQQLTTFATEFVAATDAPSEEFTLEPDFDSASASSELATVEFSYDPTTPVPDVTPTSTVQFIYDPTTSEPSAATAT